MYWRDIIIYTQKTKPLRLLFLVSHNIYYFLFFVSIFIKKYDDGKVIDYDSCCSCSTLFTK